MGDQTGLLSAERQTEGVDRDGWIEEKMKEQDWSESGQGQAQELRFWCIKGFFAFFLSSHSLSLLHLHSTKLFFFLKI